MFVLMNNYAKFYKFHTYSFLIENKNMTSKMYNDIELFLQFCKSRQEKQGYQKGIVVTC